MYSLFSYLVYFGTCTGCLSTLGLYATQVRSVLSFSGNLFSTSSILSPTLIHTVFLYFQRITMVFSIVYFVIAFFHSIIDLSYFSFFIMDIIKSCKCLWYAIKKTPYQFTPTWRFTQFLRCFRAGTCCPLPMIGLLLIPSYGYSY